MIDLKTKGLPNTIMVQGKPYSIYTDYRVWIRVAQDIKKLKPGHVVNVTYIFKDDFPERINLQEILTFLSPPQELPRGSRNDVIALDYDIDADYIYAAILGQYGIDLVDVEELHWWKFQAMLKGLNDSTKLREIMGFRCYKKETRKDDPYERLRAAWEIIEIDETEQEEIDRFSSVFEVPEQGQTES